MALSVRSIFRLSHSFGLLQSLAFAFMLLCLISASLADDTPPPDRHDKLRILVDKVLMRSTNWVMREEHVKEIAEAGFNVVCPRLGGEDFNRVREVAAWAQKYNIRCLPWIRGTLPARTGPKMLYANGTEQEICSPNSDELWQWMTHLIVEYARISMELPALMGVFLDFENYHPPQRPGHVYSLSYDTAIISDFAKSKGLSIPDLQKADRHQFLVNRALHGEFSDFQINRWRNRCRELRRSVDSINPNFRFVVNPAKGTLFLVEAAFPEWSTSTAPVILADDITYGRPSLSASHDDSLKINRERLETRAKKAQGLKVPFLYIGGIDPADRNADPEFSARNAVMICEVSDGYWVFYEGPEIGRDHEEYFRWFHKANSAIMGHNFHFSREQRITPDVAAPEKR